MKSYLITESQWDEIANPIYIAILPIHAHDFGKSFELEPLLYYEDGLGECTAFLFEIEKTFYWTSSFCDHEDEDSLVSVHVRSTEPDTNIALEKLLLATQIKKNSLRHIGELGKARWLLSRVDDNGKELEMFRFHEERCALYVQKNTKLNAISSTTMSAKLDRKTEILGIPFLVPTSGF